MPDDADRAERFWDLRQDDLGPQLAAMQAARAEMERVFRAAAGTLASPYCGEALEALDGYMGDLFSDATYGLEQAIAEAEARYGDLTDGEHVRLERWAGVLETAPPPIRFSTGWLPGADQHPKRVPHLPGQPPPP